MAKLSWPMEGQPLPELEKRDILEIPVNRPLWRLYNSSGGYPVKWYEFRDFGPTASRFDHHLLNASGEAFAQDRGILYAGHNGPVCLAEFFQLSRVIDRHFREPWLVAFKPTRPLRLLNLKSLYTTKIGLSTAIHSGRTEYSRAWARAFYQAYPGIDGICYASSMHNNSDAFALFEHAENALPVNPVFHTALVDRRLEKMLFTVARDIGYRIV